MGDIKKYEMYIDGKWVEAESGEFFQSQNPFTGEMWASLPKGGQADVDKAVRAAKKAFDEGPWGKMLPKDRGHLMHKLADLIEENAEELAQTETRDNGKLIREMLGQIQSLPRWYHYFAGLADKIQGEVIPLDKENILNYTLREPLGVVGLIVPWNSPLLLITFKLAPALAAGNTVVIKPSKYAPCSTLEFAKLVEKAGFPSGVVNVVTGMGEEVGDALINHPDVSKIAFTGGTDTGRSVAQKAGATLKRLTLELGGKSPNIVFEDADVDNALSGVIGGIFAASGQSCVAGSRLLVQNSIKESFLESLVKRAKRIKLGDPLEMETEMGPIANQNQLNKIKEYVEIGLQEGAKLLCGGKQPSDLGGLFFEPTIFEGENGMRIAQEEIFGPVLCAIGFEDEREAIKLANDTVYGLAAGVWTNDLRRAHRVAAQIKAGTVWINHYRDESCASPFGGYKMSGYGRENGMEAIKEYTQIKSVWVELSGKVKDPFVLF